VIYSERGPIGMTDQTILEAKGLSKSYGPIHAVKDVSFHIKEGETYGLLGPNGSGKTTTISMICGLLPADAGSVTVGGMPMTTTTLKPKSLIGLVPQELAIYPDLSARENLMFFGRLYSLAGPALVARVDEVLQVIGLADRAKDRAGTFSGGMKRRLNIGIGLIHTPTLLVLDEPTVGVDPQSRNAILESIEQLTQAGLAVLYTTHYMEEAQRLCDRVAIIDGGVVRAEGTQQELVRLVGENERIRVKGSGKIKEAAARVKALPGVADVSTSSDEVSILAPDVGAILTEALQTLSSDGMTVDSVTVEKPDLETVFLHLTGKALRD
jgi:ABC-2 type transport system ATP-binding protein